MQSSEIPDLSDPAHNAIRGELARLFVERKADIGLAGHDDTEIVARTDDIMAFLLNRYGLAELKGDDAWLARFQWFVDACNRLQQDQTAVPMNG